MNVDNQLIIFVKDFSEYNQMMDYMLLDNQENFISITEKLNSNKITEMLKKIRIQKATKGKLNFLFAKSYELYKILEKETSLYSQVIVLFFNSSFLKSKYPAQILKDYKLKWNNIKYVLFYIDIVNHAVSYHANYLRLEGVFDCIYTIDEMDAKKYDMKLWNTPYSIVPELKEIKKEYDLYFCGVTKGRKEIIKKILRSADKKNIDYRMKIVCNNKEEEKYFEAYKNKIEITEKYQKYNGLLKDTLKAECILELVQEGQKALTLRPYEAVAYNKKLLTNNKTIFEFKYYDPKFIRYFSKVEDIDWEWVKNEEEVDYHYQGDFSPKWLLEDIKKQLV